MLATHIFPNFIAKYNPKQVKKGIKGSVHYSNKNYQISMFFSLRDEVF